MLDRSKRIKSSASSSSAAVAPKTSSAYVTQRSAFINPRDVASFFSSTGMAALALDSAFTPTRVKSNAPQLGGVSVAGQGLASNGSEMTAPAIAVHDFFNVLKPTNRHKVWEMDCGFATAGTVSSVLGGGGEGDDKRMKRGGGGGGGAEEEALKCVVRELTSSVSLGAWDDKTSGAAGGRIAEASDEDNSDGEESSGPPGTKYFGLAACLRAGGGTAPLNRSQVLANLFNTIKPDRVAVSSFAPRNATGGLNLGGYWPAILGKPLARADVGVLTSVSASTRSHGWIAETGELLQRGIKGTLVDGSRGFLTSELARGGCLEQEELAECVENIRSLADVYDPEGGRW